LTLSQLLITVTFGILKEATMVLTSLKATGNQKVEGPNPTSSTKNGNFYVAWLSVAVKSGRHLISPAVSCHRWSSYTQVSSCKVIGFRQNYLWGKRNPIY